MGDYFLRQAYFSHFGYIKSGMIKRNSLYESKKVHYWSLWPSYNILTNITWYLVKTMDIFCKLISPLRIQWKTFTKSFFNPSLIDIEKYKSFNDLN